MNINQLARIAVGSFAFSLTAILVAIISVPFIEGPLEEIYRANEDIWRNGVIGDGFNDSSTFVYWLLHKLVFGICMAILYEWSCPSLSTQGWRRGFFVGLISVPMIAAIYLGLWSVMTLPTALWLWWAGFYFFSGTISGAVMGLCMEKTPRFSAK